MKVLKYANIETFIIFRNSTPILISICDWMFLGRELPNFRSSLSLVLICLGSILYTLSDSQFSVKAYLWVVVWYVFFCFDAIFIKHRVDTITVINNWERVFYQNTWASILLAIKIVYDEKKLTDVVHSGDNWNAYLFLTAGCVIGISMSYFSLTCRKILTATYFTLIGNLCKFITILISVILWKKHASWMGILCVTMSILIGMAYKQSPLRIETSNDEEFRILVQGSP
jgi:GDP-mannose transporter